MISCDFCDAEATIFDAPDPAEAELMCGDPYCDCEKHEASGHQGFNNWCKSCHNWAWQDI